MFYAVKWREKTARGPFLVGRKGNRLLWGGGPSYCDWPKNAKILKTYRHRYYEKAFLAFCADYPPKKSKPCFSAGWLAPDGSFYTCRSWEHDSLASRLAAALYQNAKGVQHLEAQGWARVYNSGGVGRVKGEFTQAQLDTLFDLSEIEDGTDAWKMWLRMTVRAVAS